MVVKNRRMETPDRDKREYELAAALLLLWIILDGVKFYGAGGWNAFKSAFDTHIKPILADIYGRARASVAEQFGHHYETVEADDGTTAVRIPGLDRAVEKTPDRYTTRSHASNASRSGCGRKAMSQSRLSSMKRIVFRSRQLAKRRVPEKWMAPKTWSRGSELA